MVPLSDCSLAEHARGAPKQLAPLVLHLHCGYFREGWMYALHANVHICPDCARTSLSWPDGCLTLLLMCCSQCLPYRLSSFE